MRRPKVAAAIIFGLIVIMAFLFAGCAMTPDNNGGGTIVGNPEKRQQLEPPGDGGKTAQTLDADDRPEARPPERKEKDEAEKN